MIIRNLLISIFSLIVCNGFSQVQNVTSIDNIVSSEMESYQKISTFVENNGYTDYDLIYQRMVWNVDPNVKYIQGEVTSYIKSKTDNLANIEFDLYDGLEIDSIVQRGEKVNFLHNNNKIEIPLFSELSINGSDSFKIYYQGEPAEGGFGSFKKSVHNEIPIIWTLSEPYGAMEWWPCKQSLIDKIDSIDIFVKTPEEYRTASNGVLVSDSVSNGFRIMHWKHRFPIATYLVAIAVTNYSYYSDYLELENGDSIEILNYVYPEDLEDAKMNTPATIQIMKLYNNIIGEYPFAKEKYGHAQFGWGGGMENQTMSFVTNFKFGLIAHELAHQWFGDYITLSSWHDIWLNESFATYMAALTIENLKSKSDWYAWKKGSVEQITSSPGGSVFVYDTTSVSRIFNTRLSYTKGGYLLHMLRWVLGDEAFFEGLRSYFNDPEIANGFAQNQQFVQHMEMAGDTSLTEFFNDWYYGEGYPIYTIEFGTTENGKILVELSQSTSHNSVDFFEMPVPVRLYNQDKTDSADFRLINTQDDQQFSLSVDFDVANVVIDPDLWLISKRNENLNVSNELPDNILKVHPNPTNNHLYITVSTGAIVSGLSLYDVDGKLLKNYAVNTRDIDLSGFVPGIYFLNIKTSEGEFIRKISKN